MPLHFTCPHCREQTLVDDRYAGYSGECIQCGRPIVVPGVATAQQRAVAAPARSWFVKLGYWPLILLSGAAVAIAGFGMFTLVMAVVQPAVQAARGNALKTQCARNLRQIGAAMLAYEVDYGTLPPAYVVDAQGQPQHSWRVLILPYLGPAEKDLYRQYNFSVPWNAPENTLVMSRMPKVFACPADKNAQATFETNYQVIVGKNSLFTGKTPTRRSQATDGLGHTILVVETSGTATGWLEPKDLIDGVLTYQVGIDIGGNHAGGANVLMASGETEFLSINMPPEHVQSLVTPASDEPNPLDE